MKQIFLTRGKVALVDDADFDSLNKHKWAVDFNPSNNSWRAKRTVIIDGKKKDLKMHRVIMGLPDGIEVDHADGDGLNNQRYNLRAATHQQNSFNRKMHKDNRHGVKGISWNRGAYRARICISGKTINLGRFPSKESAAQCYAEAAQKYHGEFARI